MVRVGCVLFAAIFAFLTDSFVAAPLAPVQASNLFDSLFGRSTARESNRRYRKRVYRKRAKRRVIYRNDYTRRRAKRGPRISSPKYYSYKPDILKNISLASLARFETASTDASALPVGGTPFAEARSHLSSIKVRTLPEVAAAIKEHYAKHPSFIWISGGKVNAKAREALNAFEHAGIFGLSPKDYAVAVPQDGGGDASQIADYRALIRFEMELSAKTLMYVLDAKRGRIDPNRISGYHDFERKKVDLPASIAYMAATDQIVEYLESRNPDNAEFRALASELVRLHRDGGAELPSIPRGTFLKPGAHDPAVVTVMAAIRLLGSDTLLAKHTEALAADGNGMAYTPGLVALVRDFQREKGLRGDGIVGRRTIARLKITGPGDKMAKLELAMERMRWLPRDLGDRHVFINQPAYTATYSHTGRDPFSMKVVVGKKANQTYFFMDKIETVEFNPYWGVPLSIIANEMAPKLYRNPGYLDRIGYEVTTLKGRRVSSRSVNWYAVVSKRKQINVRQPPGPKNALGQLKILFPNKHAIYMHDTPAKKLFARDKRAFSHGCVRLEDPRGMAAAVLGKSKKYIASRIAGGRNDKDKVKADVPVYVSYFTAWPTAQGTVKYYEDIYDRDVYLTKAIKATSAARKRRG